MDELKSEGKCIYCNELFTEKEMSKHLNAHLKKLENKEEKCKVFHISIKGGGGMFLNILISDKTKMKDIDSFLKDIWLDCCGHMSHFSHGEMNHSAESIFTSTKKLLYDYDMGDTTRVELKLMSTYHLLQKEKIKLLSRNEPLIIMCSVCNKKPATEICSVHIYEGNDGFYCEACAKKHEKVCEDFDDFAKMPVVNSPRMAVCGYTGGSIDLERDGIYIEQKH